VDLGKEVVALDQKEQCVSVTTRDEAESEHVVTAKYVIACDGASSTIRRLLNIPLDDLGFDEPWLVVDLIVNDDAVAKLPSVCAQYCDPARPYTYIIGPGNHRRWEIMLHAGEDPRAVECEESVWKLLSRWLNPDDAKLWRAGSYRFHALVAHRWREGRVFLAGDAAHQQPPFIGQGMCQGVRDVTNLCWKLVSVLQGEAADQLLDSYEQERSRHVRTLTGRIKHIGASICERDPKAARARDEELLRQGGGKAPVVTRQEIVPPLQTGFLATANSFAVGTIFPQPRLSTSTGTALLDEVAGLGWRLFWDGRAGDDYPDVAQYGIQAMALGGNHARDSDGLAAAWFERHGCIAAIVRPDHYVYGVLSGPSHAEEACRQLQIRLRNPRAWGTADETA
jgi:3-(3-hydroxy-phenyl)propionate hydroxylase